MGGWMFTLFVFALGVSCVAIPYFASNNIAASYLSTVWDPEIAFDRDFPVINWMIIPYAALYLFYPATLFIAPRDDRGRMELALGIQGLALATMLCVFFFMALPGECKSSLVLSTCCTKRSVLSKASHSLSCVLARAKMAAELVLDTSICAMIDPLNEGTIPSGSVFGVSYHLTSALRSGTSAVRYDNIVHQSLHAAVPCGAIPHSKDLFRHLMPRS